MAAMLACFAHATTAISMAIPQQTFRFPDGSSYRGGVKDGMQHGMGEYRSVQGDVYVGEFSCGTYEGPGKHADDLGNVYQGEFSAGVFDGVGTYTHADGRAECNRYREGREVGEGVRWSVNGARAWRLHNGQQESEVDIAAAAAIASTLGLRVPSPTVFAPSADGEARLRRRLLDAGGDADSDADGEDAASDLGFNSLVAVGACDGVLSRGGGLIAHSTRPLVAPAECDRIVEECEARGGWSLARHADECYATTDQPVSQLVHTAAFPVPSLYLPCTFPVPSLYLPCTFPAGAHGGLPNMAGAPQLAPPQHHLPNMAGAHGSLPARLAAPRRGLALYCQRL